MNIERINKTIYLEYGMPDCCQCGSDKGSVCDNHSFTPYDPPDYYHDIDACKDMVKKLAHEDADNFSHALDDIVYENDIVRYNSLPHNLSSHNATAPQICEAFMRVMGIYNSGDWS